MLGSQEHMCQYLQTSPWTSLTIGIPVDAARGKAHLVNKNRNQIFAFGPSQSFFSRTHWTR